MGVCSLEKRPMSLSGPWWECNKWKDPTWSKIWHPFARPGMLALLQTAIGYPHRQWQIISQGPARARSICLEKQINPCSELRLKKTYRAQWCMCTSLGGLWWLATGGYLIGSHLLPPGDTASSWAPIAGLFPISLSMIWFGQKNGQQAGGG